jgi:hypothetical protein
MLAAIRDKDDATLKSLATDYTTGWRDALPKFALEMREHFSQMTGQPFSMTVGESLVDGEFAAVKCDGRSELKGIYLVLFLKKTSQGWKNCSLQNSPPNVSLAQQFAGFKSRQKRP